MIGGVFRKDASSLGNLNPASLKALPKSLSFGKSRWQVLQDVPYCRENAGIAQLSDGKKAPRRTMARTTNEFPFERCILSPFGSHLTSRDYGLAKEFNGV